MALADAIVVGVGAEGILTAKLNQLPHQHVGFFNGQLVEGGSIGPLAIIAIVMHFGLHGLGGVVGDGDADVSLIHGVYLPFCSSWNILSIAEKCIVVKGYI